MCVCVCVCMCVRACVCSGAYKHRAQLKERQESVDQLTNQLTTTTQQSTEEVQRLQQARQTAEESAQRMEGVNRKLLKKCKAQVRRNSVLASCISIIHVRAGLHNHVRLIGVRHRDSLDGTQAGHNRQDTLCTGITLLAVSRA